jgi:hypothetical protein
MALKPCKLVLTEVMALDLILEIANARISRRESVTSKLGQLGYNLECCGVVQVQPKKARCKILRSSFNPIRATGPVFELVASSERLAHQVGIPGFEFYARGESFKVTGIRSSGRQLFKIVAWIYNIRQNA